MNQSAPPMDPGPTALFNPATLEEWCRQNQQPFREISSWSEGLSVLRPFPGLPNRDTFPFERPRMFAGRVTEACSLPHDGYICAPGNFLIYRGLGARDYVPQADLGRYFRGLQADGHFLLSIPEDQQIIEQECVFFGGNLNFGHFIFQSLLRLACLRWLPELDAFPIAVYDTLPRRYLEFLDLLAFPASRRISIPMDRPVRFRKVWAVSSPMFRREGGVAMIWPDAIWELRAAFARACRTETKPRRRLYISRGKADWRRLINEREIAAILARNGYEEVDFGTMSAADQIRLVASAESIVSVLGAASQITMFSPPDCVQLQLTPREFLATFGPIAAAAVMGQPYARIYGRIATPEEVSSAGLEAVATGKPIDVDFVVDAGLLTSAVSILERHFQRQAPQ